MSTKDGGGDDRSVAPIGLPEEVFRRLLRGIGDYQEGLALWRIRTYLEVSLREAASHADIATGHLWHIEHGERHARQWTLIRLCLASLSLSPAQTIVILSIAGYSPR
jgi:hypothetical protein